MDRNWKRHQSRSHRAWQSDLCQRRCLCPVQAANFCPHVSLFHCGKALVASLASAASLYLLQASDIDFVAASIHSRSKAEAGIDSLSKRSTWNWSRLTLSLPALRQ